MNRRRLIFFAIFGAFHLITFIFTIVMDTSATFLFDMVNYIGLFKYLAFLGLAMVTTEFAWAWMDQKVAKKKQAEMTLENNTLKAKVYDMQESGKPKPEVGRSAAK